MKRKAVRVRVDGYAVVSEALRNGILGAMNKTDKYHERPLTDMQRGLLERHIADYFWLAIDEAGVEIK